MTRLVEERHPKMRAPPAPGDLPKKSKGPERDEVARGVGIEEETRTMTGERGGGGGEEKARRGLRKVCAREGDTTRGEEGQSMNDMTAEGEPLRREPPRREHHTKSPKPQQRAERGERAMQASAVPVERRRRDEVCTRVEGGPGSVERSAARVGTGGGRRGRTHEARRNTRHPWGFEKDTTRRCEFSARSEPRGEPRGLEKGQNAARLRGDGAGTGEQGGPRRGERARLQWGCEVSGQRGGLMKESNEPRAK